MNPLTLLVWAKPSARYLRLLERLPDSTTVAAGNELEAFQNQAAHADVILNCFGPREPIEALWRMSPKVRWVHSLSAGVEKLLFPELVESPVPLTNSRGVFARSLAEFAIGAMLFFSKEFRRMIRAQQAGIWEEFDVEELYGKTVGIVGYGGIGRAVAERARAFGMKVVALRRRPELSGDDGLADRVFSPAQIREMLPQCDYVVVAAALTPETRGLLGEGELRVMKESAVLINIGRGPVVVESALVEALQQKRIRGAGLDVFDNEPLPAGHPFYSLENVLLSPHSADHTPGWEDLAMELFLENFERFRKGEPLLNVVDKRSGY